MGRGAGEGGRLLWILGDAIFFWEAGVWVGCRAWHRGAVGRRMGTCTFSCVGILGACLLPASWLGMFREGRLEADDLTGVA